MNLHVVRYPHPMLRYQCKKLLMVDQWVFNVANAMFQLVDEERGMGMAAVQVGLPLNLFVVTKPRPYVFINPTIKEVQKKKTMAEACLSLPGVVAKIPRYNRCIVEGHALDGTKQIISMTGMAARCAQHEKDHLSGVMFIDYLTPEGLEQHCEVLETLEHQFLGAGGVQFLSEDPILRAVIEETERKYCDA